MMIALDCSNYTGHITVQQALHARAEGISRAIVGLQYPAPGYGYPAGVAAAQMASWLAAGVEVEVYFESTPVSVAWPHVADWAHRILRPWLAVEEGSGFETVDQIMDALDEIDALGIGRCGIYTSAYMWHQLGLDRITEFADRDLWVADYDGKQDCELSYPFGGFTKCVMKQYAGDTEFAGIKAIDLSYYEEEDVPLELESLDQSEAIEAVKASALAVGPDGGQWFEVKQGSGAPAGTRDYLVRIKER